MDAEVPFQYLLGNVGFCCCCLRSQAEGKLVTDSAFPSFFRDVAKVEFQNMDTIQVCLWCTVLVQRTLKLLENVRRANRLLNIIWSTKPANLRQIKSYVSTEKEAITNNTCNVQPQKTIDTTAAESTQPIRKVEQCLLQPAEVDMLDVQVKNEKLETPVGSDDEHDEDIFTGFDVEFTEDLVVAKEEDKQFIEALENVCEISRNKPKGKKRGRKKKMVAPARETPARRSKRPYRRGVRFALGPAFRTARLTSEEARATVAKMRAAALRGVAPALRCDLCGCSFAERRLAEEHAALHEPSAGPHVCEYCTLRFVQESALQEHVAETHERGMACVECNYITASAELLVEHFREEHANIAPSDIRLRRLSSVREVVRVRRITEAERAASYCRALREPAYREAPAKCVACAEGFPTTALYRLHHLKHSIKRGVHRCDICRQFVSSAAALARHRRKHYERYACAACSYEGAARDACVDHYWRDHLPGPRYLLCDVCYESYDVPSVYHTHTRKHLTQSSCQQCSQCGKIVRSKAALVIHMASHADESHKLPVQCDLCGHIYKNASLLQQHKKRIHTADSKKYECNMCSRKFYKRLDLIYHFSRNHLQCPECQKMFERKKSLLRHIMNVHERVPKPRNHKCEMCEKAFTRSDMLVAHSRIHTGEKPFKCTQCDRRFTHSGTLYTHVRSIHLKIKQRRGPSARKRNAAAQLAPAQSQAQQPLAQPAYC